MEIRDILKKGDAKIVQVTKPDGEDETLVVPNKATPTTEEDVDLGIPYGLPWAKIIGQIKASPKDIEEKLHKHGIFTAEQLRARPQVAMNAIRDALGLDLTNLLDKTDQFVKEIQNG